MYKRIVNALMRGATSQLQPSMLLLLLIPFVAAVVFWALTAWLAWTPLTDWLRMHLFESTGVMRWFGHWLAGIGLGDFGGFASTVLASLLLLPLMFASALVLIAVLAMPVVTHHLGKGPYRDVIERGRWSVPVSLGNALTSLALFVIGYVATLPLWLVPPLALVVPWLWWSWLTARMMRLDSLVEHAEPQERRALIARYRREYFVLGLAVTLLNYVPPLFLITPVLSALVFVHYSLARLRELRGGADAIRLDHHR